MHIKGDDHYLLMSVWLSRPGWFQPSCTVPWLSERPTPSLPTSPRPNCPQPTSWCWLTKSPTSITCQRTASRRYVTHSRCSFRPKPPPGLFHRFILLTNFSCASSLDPAGEISRKRGVQQCPLQLPVAPRRAHPAGAKPEGEEGRDSGSGGQQRLWKEHHHPAAGEVLWPPGGESGEKTNTNTARAHHHWPPLLCLFTYYQRVDD